MKEKPLYTHDSECCIYLGQFDASHEAGWGMVDLYVCPTQVFGPTVIARFGNDGPEYGSGLTFARTSRKYAEAVRRALAGNHLTDPEHVKKFEEVLAEFDANNQVTYWRNPTESEIKFGHGAIHYREFKWSECTKADGTLKKWLKADDGRRYNK